MGAHSGKAHPPPRWRHGPPGLESSRSRAIPGVETSASARAPTDWGSACRGVLSPSPTPSLRGPDFSLCVSTAALLFMELRAGAELAVLTPGRGPGHALPSARGAAAAGPPGLSREPREEQARAAEPEREPRRRRAARDPVLWLCTAMHSTAW